MAKKKTVTVVLHTESGKELRIELDVDTHRDYKQLAKSSGMSIEEYIVQVLIEVEKESKKKRRF